MNNTFQNNASHTWEQYDKQNKRNGVLISVLVHAAIIAIFFFFGLSSSFPPPETGILINFGTTETGLGSQPSEVTKQATEVAAIETAPPAPEVQQQAEQQIATQDVVEAPAVKKTEKKKEDVKPVKHDVQKPVEQPKKPVPEGPKVDKTSLYQGSTGQLSDENHPSNEGITYGPGDQGDPNGDPSSTEYYGKNTGFGHVAGVEMAGRDLLSIPPITEKYQESGKVAISVKVDRTGKVLFAKYTQKGSTTTSQQLIQLAEESARQGKFSPNSKAVEEQFGTITFVFKLE